MSLKITHARRLIALANHLEKKVKPSRFRLDTWRRTIPECGTVACACGHAPHVPSLYKAGFRINRIGAGFSRPVFGELTEWEAVQEFFGLTLRQCRYLFSTYSYAAMHDSKEDVVARLRQFVRTHSALYKK